MITVRQLIKDTILAYDASLDVSDSSTLTDLLINPGSAMLDPVIAQIKFYLANLSLTDPAAMTDSEVDAIAANFLITRNVGTKSSGYVELLYTAPQSVFIPAGTKFTTSAGVTFVISKQWYIATETMESNIWNYPYYSTGPIPVESETVGAQTAIDPDTINGTDLDPAPARVTNPTAFTGGSDAEDNVTFVARLIEEVINGNLGSAKSIETTLKKTFSTIKNIKVRGMGDSEMLRDLVTSGISLYDVYNISDFYGKVSGLNDSPYPQSRAYYSVFYDDPTTSGLIDDIPPPELFLSEFDNDQYAGMYKKTDALKATIQTLTVLEDDFQATALNSIWRKGDANAAADYPIRPSEIDLDIRNGQQKLRLGNNIASVAVDDMQITVTGKFLTNIINYLKRATEMSATASADVPYFNSASETIKYAVE